MKKLYMAFLGVLLGILVVVGFVSAVDATPTMSQVENRKLATKPKFSLGAIFDRSWMQEFEAFYTDTFPMRERLLGVNKSMNNFYYYSAGGDSALLIQGSAGGAQGGESLAAVEQALSGDKDEDTATQKPDETVEQGSQEETATPDVPEDVTPEPEVDPDLNAPTEDMAETVGAVLMVDTRAMDIPTANENLMTRYAMAVTELDEAMDLAAEKDVRTISLLAPNAGEFYSPDSFHTGVHSQKDMIDFAYGQMGENVTTVDAYSALRSNVDEYIYFRTDHHWTALGAYYAYTKFCEALNMRPVALDKFESGTYDHFVGSMYTFTSGYPQSEVLWNNPDSLTYYLPLAETSAKYYTDPSLSGGIEVSVVYTKMNDSVSNKYLCFIGGDTPICVIETDVPGPTIMVVKESYGNAFAPFLTSHYGKIIVVDPREFNEPGEPSLNLANFAAEQGVDDLLVINYPFMINNSTYITWLERLYQEW